MKPPLKFVYRYWLLTCYFLSDLGGIAFVVYFLTGFFGLTNQPLGAVFYPTDPVLRALTYVVVTAIIIPMAFDIYVPRSKEADALGSKYLAESDHK